MANVYVVTNGDYSDYRIEAVFSTQEDAEAYVLDQNSSPKAEDPWYYPDDVCRVEEYPLNSIPVPDIGKPIQVYSCRLDLSKHYRKPLRIISVIDSGAP